MELHKSKYCVPKPFEIPALVSVCGTGSEELETEGLPAVTSMPVPSSSRQSIVQICKTNISAPHTPTKHALHPPSSPLTDITSSAPSSPIKPDSTVSFHIRLHLISVLQPFYLTGGAKTSPPFTTAYARPDAEHVSTIPQALHGSRACRIILPNAWPRH